MAGPDGTYQAKAGIMHNAETMFIDSDGYFNFAGTSFSGSSLLELMSKQTIENTARTTIGQGATSNVFSVVNVPTAYKYIRFSMTSTCAAGSAWLPSVPAVGRELWINLARGSCASGNIWFSTSGCSLIGLWGSAISGFYLYNSAASCGRVKIIATTSSEWAVMEATSYAE